MRGGFTEAQEINYSDPNHAFLIRMRYLKSNGVVLRMAKYTWLTAYLKHYNEFTLIPRKTLRQGKQEKGKKLLYRKMFSDVIHELAHKPSNHIWESSPRGYLNRIKNKISEAKKTLTPNLPPDTLMRTLGIKTLPDIIKVVAATTRVSFGLIMHLISARLQKGMVKLSMFETTAELLQCIVLQLVSPCSNMRLFNGDLHTCQLHCTRCATSFGIIGTPEVVLANAQFAILKHHGICILPWDQVSRGESDLQSDGNETDLNSFSSGGEMQEFLFENVLPPMFANVKNLSKAMHQFRSDIAVVKCKYGNHEPISDTDNEGGKRNFVQNCTFTEAVNMDASFYLSDIPTSNARVYCTTSVLNGLFQTMNDVHDLYEGIEHRNESESTDKSEHESKWKNYYARDHQPEEMSEIVSGFVDLDPDDKNAYKGMKDFCHLLDALFMNNMALALSAAPVGAEMDDDFRSHVRVFLGISDQYVTYTFDDEIEMTISGIDAKVSRAKCFTSRPFQRHIIESVEQEPVGEGEGWDRSEAITWFQNNPAEKQVSGSISVQKMAEDEILFQTMTHVKWTRSRMGAKIYKFKCDMNRFISDDEFLKAKIKRLLGIKEFDCSQFFIRTLPFDVVSTNEGNWINIHKLMEPRRKSIKKAKTECVGGLKATKSRWGHLPIFEVYKRDQDAKAYNRVLVKGEDLKNDLSQEPWIFNTMIRLSCVASHRMAILGEGSRAKVRNEKSEEPVYLDEDDDDNSFDEFLQDNAPDFDANHPTTLPVLDNIWWCSDNYSKHCVYGCIANLLHHLGAKEAAQNFKSLVTLDKDSLLHALNLQSFPKAVMSNVLTNHQIDKLQLGIWLLRSRYNVDHSTPMIVEQFSTITSIVDKLMQFKFPVILSMNITHSIYQHVICVWEGMIIDFEEKTMYPLTASNVEFSCGQHTTFVGLHCGYGLFPSKAMRKHIKKEYGILHAGYADYTGCQHYLFQQRRKRTRKRKGNAKRL